MGQASKMTSLPHGPFGAPPIRCTLNSGECYEIQFESLTKRGKGGKHDQVHVYFSDDGMQTWRELPLSLSWLTWIRYMWGGFGGDMWPPRGEDVFGAYLKGDGLAIKYGTVFQPNKDGTVTAWEAIFDRKSQLWNINFLENF